MTKKNNNNSTIYTPSSLPLSRSIRAAKLFQKSDLKFTQLLGEGFFSIVHLAEHTSGHLAVKVFKEEINDPATQKKILDEINRHKELFHPNILEFRGVYWDHGRLNMVCLGEG